MLRVECEKCNTSYQVDERRVPESGLPMRCTKCGHTFTVPGEKAAAARLRHAGKNTLIAFGTVDEHGRTTLTSSPPRNTPLLERSTPLLETRPEVLRTPVPPSVEALRTPAPPSASRKSVPPRPDPSRKSVPPMAALRTPAPSSVEELRKSLPPLAVLQTPVPPSVEGVRESAPSVPPAAPVRKSVPPRPDPSRKSIPPTDAARKSVPPMDVLRKSVPPIDAPRIDVKSETPADAPPVAEVGSGEREWFERTSPLPTVPPPGPSEEEVFHELDWDVEPPAMPEIVAETESHAETAAAAETAHAPAANEPETGAEAKSEEVVAEVQPDEVEADDVEDDEDDEDDVSEGDLVTSAQPVVAKATPPVAEDVAVAIAPELQKSLGPVQLSREELLAEIRDELEANPVVARAKAASVRPAPVVAAAPAAHVSPPPGSADATIAPVAAQAPVRVVEKSPPKRRSKALWLVAAALLAGGALEATPYGAFGRIPLGDQLHAGEYARLAAEAAEKTRAKMAVDVFPDTTAALEALGRAQSETPRAGALAAYRAMAESAARLRFAAGGASDVEDAQRLLTGAGGAGDEDALFLRGEIELRAMHPRAAADAFQSALAKRPSARAHFGLARAHRLAGDVDASSKEVEATLSASPRHAGARILRASLAWERTRNEGAVSEDLAAVLDGPVKEAASPRELASAWALRGRIEMARGRTSEARAAFEAARKREPHDPATSMGQGELLLAEGRYTEALARFDAAVESEPAIPSILGSARAKLLLERAADAKTQLTALEKEHPKDAKVAYWLAKTEEALGNADAAEKKYGDAIARTASNDRDAIAPYADWAALLARRGRAKEAEQKLEEARAKLESPAQAARALGDLMALQGLFDAALLQYQAAIDQDPKDALPHLRKAEALRKMGLADQASAELDKVAEADKDYPGLVLERALLAAQSGDSDRGATLLRTALAKAPDDPDLQRRVGAAYASIGQFADAVPLLRAALAKQANSAEASYELGRALFLLQGGPAELEAPRLFKKAVELNPHRAAYHAGMAWMANEGTSAQPDVAKEHVEKALAIDALLADGYWQRGVLERKLGALPDSIRDVKRAIELLPTHAGAHAALAESFEAKNDGPSALAAWQKALKLNAHQPYWKYRYGRLLLSRAAAAEASKQIASALAEAKKIDPLPAWAIQAELTCAHALQKAGRSADAIEHYRRYLDLSPQTSSDRGSVHAALVSLGAK